MYSSGSLLCAAPPITAPQPMPMLKIDENMATATVVACGALRMTSNSTTRLNRVNISPQTMQCAINAYGAVAVTRIRNSIRAMPAATMYNELAATTVEIAREQHACANAGQSEQYQREGCHVVSHAHHLLHERLYVAIPRIVCGHSNKCKDVELPDDRRLEQLRHTLDGRVLIVGHGWKQKGKHHESQQRGAADTEERSTPAQMKPNNSAQRHPCNDGQRNARDEHAQRGLSFPFRCQMYHQWRGDGSENSMCSGRAQPC